MKTENARAPDELMKAIMQREDGRAFICFIMELTGAYSCSYTDEPISNAIQMGRRSIGLDLLNMLRNTDNGLESEFLMLRERKDSLDNQKTLDKEDED